MRVDAGHHGEKARIAGADDADAAVVAGHIFKQPGDGVVGVGAFVDGFGIVMVGQGAHHHEFAFALEAAADVFADVDVAGAGEFRTVGEEGGAGGAVHAIGGALHEEGQRGGDVGGLEDHGVQLDAVAHGDHDFGALVVVEDVMDGFAGAAVDGFGLVRIDHNGAVAGGDRA